MRNWVEKNKAGLFLAAASAGIAYGIYALATLSVHGGQGVLTLLNMDDCASQDGAGIFGSEGSLAGSNSASNPMYTVTCSALQQMYDQGVQTWGETVFGCIDASPYGPWSVSDLLQTRCKSLNAICSSWIKNAFYEYDATNPNKDEFVHALGGYCAPNVAVGNAVGFVFLCVAGAITSLMTLAAFTGGLFGKTTETAEIVGTNHLTNYQAICDSLV